MRTEEWQRIEALFHETSSMAPDERSVYLRRACAGDESLQSEVESLISSFESSEGLMEQPAFELGIKVLQTRNDRDSLIGKVIGSYEVLKRLGKGGMGEVYLAKDIRLERKVALKFLSPEFVGDNWAKRQLAREAQAVAMLDHANICTVHGLEEVGEHSFIVMQFIEGETLADSVRAGSLPPHRVITLAGQIVSALAEAHAHGIIHRDIKPGNIMVTPAGQVKVLDFGLAKTVRLKRGEHADDSSIMSQNGLVLGTVAYMSPEQLRAERIDFRTDIFSFGVVLYELVCGRNPFARGSQAETISAILTSELPNLRDTMPDLAPGIDRLIKKCAEKDRDKRYSSASELLIELEEGTTEENYPYWRRHPRRVIAAVVSIALLISALGLIYGRLARVPSAANSSAAKSSSAIESLAVLPIVNESGDSSIDYLSSGLSESLITKLSFLQQLRVRPFTAVSGYKDKNLDPQRAGRELGVDSLLLVKLIKQDKSLIARSSLIRTADGIILWTEDEVVDLASLIRLEDQLVKKVTNSLALRVEDEAKLQALHGTISPGAFRQYMLGRHYWRNRDSENIKKAISHFKEAVRLDPVYARAWAGLADCYVLRTVVSFGETPTEEAMAEATAAAKEALAIDATLPEAHTALGVIHLRYTWKWPDAESEFKQAIRLKSDYAPAHHWYSQLLLVTGRWAEAVAESEQARKLDPFSPPTLMNNCRTLSLSRQHDRAISCYDRVLADNPEFDHAKYLRALVVQRRGRHDEALLTFEKLYAKNKALAGAALGYSYGRAGRVVEARRILREMETLAKTRYVPPVEFAIIYVGLDDLGKAFEWLEKAYQERFATLIYITVDPIFAGLSTDPRFTSLLQRLNLPLLHSN